MQVHNTSPLGIKDIDATLRRGKISTSDFWFAYRLLSVIEAGIILLAGIVVWILAPTYPVGLLMTVFGAVVFVPWLLVVLYLDRGTLEAKKYLLDAVVLSAKTQKVYEDRKSGKVEAMHVSFSYMGKDYVKSSSEKGNHGYFFIFDKYADKEISIAYSPKYDQVMFIKSEGERSI